ncbi:DUF6007 family protein [Staphylococcus lugdunensis]|uniref:DUF6007 family protein n=2 Tax=Staphylococcus lugdunensis TaxID=28035 RepID=UPI0039E331F4
MRCIRMNNFRETLKAIGCWDLIFLIPMFLLLSYLPIYNVFSIILNVIIVFFFAMGLILTTHILWDYFKSRR